MELRRKISTCILLVFLSLVARVTGGSGCVQSNRLPKRLPETDYWFVRRVPEWRLPLLHMRN
ncbi:hypothetical protein ACP70R_019983 [Stipagrostis hirtigluma subsp. patula]